jgi:hypothetical protein
MTITAGDITEDAGQPGLYAMKLDEDMTITAGKQSEIMTFAISGTGAANIPPVQIELRASFPGDVTTVVNNVLAVLGTPAGASMSADIAAVLAAIAALNNVSAATVKAQVVAALTSDLYHEPAGIPGENVSLGEKLGRIYQALRNHLEVNSSKKTFFDNLNGAVWSKTLSDDGTTYTESGAGGP